MSRELHRILIVGKSNSHEFLVRELKDLTQQSSIRILFFDSTDAKFENFHGSPTQNSSTPPETSDQTDQLKSPVFNLDPGKQLATAIIQDSESISIKDTSENLPDKLSFHENIHRNQILWYSFQQYFDEHKIDSIVYLASPSGLYEAVLYQVAKALELTVLVLLRSPVDDRFFSFQSISDCGNYDQNIEKPVEFSTSKIEFASICSQESKQAGCPGFSMSDILKIYAFLLRSNWFKLLNIPYIVKHAHHLHDAPKAIAEWKDPFARFFYCKSVAYFEFFTNHHEGKIDLNEKYVYFPLQSLGELHCEILTHRFGDQLLALERLARLVPDDCKIYVKSQPDQEADYLTPMFFHRIRRMQNVVRLPSCVETERVIDNSEFVATVSSRDGWKALSQGRKVLVFGHPWYRKLPGAYIYRIDMKYEDILEFEFNKLAFETQAEYLLSTAHKGKFSFDEEIETTGSKTSTNVSSAAQTIVDLMTRQKNTTFQPREC